MATAFRVSFSVAKGVGGVFAQRFFMPAHLCQHRIAKENIAHDHCHLGDKRPVLIRRYNFGFGDNVRKIFFSVAVKTFFTIGMYPGKGTIIFFMIVNAQGDPSENFGHVNPFRTDAEILLEHGSITVASCNAHRDTA